MEIKFNCSNPVCRQRISVGESMAGQSLRCPACATELQAPASKNIKFNCSNPECGQHMVVDVSEAGRFVRCPSCDKPLQVPGDPPKPIVSEPPSRRTQKKEQNPVSVITRKSGPVSPLLRLLCGWGIGAALCGLVIGGLHLRAWAALPKHLDAILDETYFHGEILSAPVENHAGTRLIYVRTIEGGVGVFMVDLRTLERAQIGSGKAANWDRGRSVKLFRWSPDDRYLAFSTIQANDQNLHVMICNGETGKQISSFEAPGSLEMGAWLNEKSMVLLDNTHRLYLYNLAADDRLGPFWKEGLVLLRQLDRTANSPVPDSDHSVAYVENGNLWKLLIQAGSAAQLTHLTEYSITAGLDYNPTTDKYLFAVTNADSTHPILCLFDPRALDKPVTPIKGCANYELKAQWIQNGAGVAYVGMEGNRYCVGIMTLDQALHANLFTAPPFDPNHGFVNANAFPEGKQVVRSLDVNPEQDKIYTVASVNYEPLSIWEYDLAGRTLRNVVPTTEHRVYSQFVAPVQASATGPNGRKIGYYYLPPRGMEPGKKYPVVMDQYSDLGFQPNSQFLANAGIFYVTVNPYGQGFPKGPTTPEDTLAVHDEILKNPNVDPRRIYLSGESLGTATIATLIDQHPDLWRGAILLSPITFQDVSRSTKMVPSFFCSFGDQDNDAVRKSMEQYAQEACAHHALTQILYGHAGHAFFDIGEHKKRYKAAATFILENR
jgi:hypothetical protein